MVSVFVFLINNNLFVLGGLNMVDKMLLLLICEVKYFSIILVIDE